MSEMEYNKGKLVPFNLTEEVAKELVLKRYEEGLDEFFETYKEQVADDPSFYEEDLFMVRGKWYKAEFQVRRRYIDYLAEATAQPDGTIDFTTYHYNGGGHWTEVVEEALNRDQ